MTDHSNGTEPEIVILTPHHLFTTTLRPHLSRSSWVAALSDIRKWRGALLTGSRLPNVLLIDAAPGLRDRDVAHLECAYAGSLVLCFDVHAHHTVHPAIATSITLVQANSIQELIVSAQRALASCVAARRHASVATSRGPHRPQERVVEILSAREREIVMLLAEGCTNKDIAARLRIRLSTAKNHVHHILHKLGATSRARAVAKMQGSHWYALAPSDATRYTPESNQSVPM